MDARPVTGELASKQQAAITGPVDQNEPEMLTYTCSGCGGQFPDMGHYFYGTSSVRCIWCAKFPKAKNERKIATA